MTGTTGDSQISELAASVALDAPRIVVLSAPVGYGKGDFFRSYARYAGALIGCELPPSSDGDIARGVLDALVARDHGRAARSAAARLARRMSSVATSSRETLRREWPTGGEAELFVINDASAALATPAGADIFAELVGSLPPQRTLGLSIRAALPPALAQIIGNLPSVTVGSADLALTLDALVRLAGDVGLSAEAAKAIHRIAHGWPLASLLLMRLAASDEGLDEAAVRALPLQSVLAFAVHRTIAALPAVVREALVVSALLRGAGHPQLVRVLGDVCDDIVFDRLSSLPFVVIEGERAFVHAEIANVLRTRFESLFKAMYERTLNALTGDGAYVDAARVALEGGDAVRAAAIVDAAPRYTAVRVPLGEYERIIDRLDRALITRFPNVWIATIPYRSFAVDRKTFVREAETVYYCLSPATDPDQRSAALMLLVGAYFNSGRREEADRLIDEALHGFAREPSQARASLLNMCAWLHGMDGHFELARRLARDAASMSRSGFADHLTLHYIDAHEAAYRGQNERVVVIIDELLRRIGDGELPVHRANTATDGAIITWANGDDDGFLRYVEVLESAMTPGLERGFDVLIDAARGRSFKLEEGYQWPVVAAVAQLFRLGNATRREDALESACLAASAADERPDPYTGILAHTALYVLDPAARPREAARLESLVAGVESEEMHEAVASLLRGGPAGILESFVRRRVLRERRSDAPRFVVELLARRVVRDGVQARLSEKEYELLALLGSAHAPLSRDRIGEALWNHLDPEEWANNLKVTISRLRAKLGMREAVQVVDGRYRLSPMIDVDLRHAESVMRECAGRPLDDASRENLRAILTSFASGAAARYERFTWGQPLLARMTDLACNAGMTLASDALARERFDESLAYASSVVSIDPFNEAACETTVRALLARGEIDTARREFRRYATALADEFGAVPSENLTELVRTSR